jgi:hypothetical protein
MVHSRCLSRSAIASLGRVGQRLLPAAQRRHREAALQQAVAHAVGVPEGPGQLEGGVAVGQRVAGAGQLDPGVDP